MRYPSDMPNRPREEGKGRRRLHPRSRVVLAIVGLVLVTLAFSLRTIATVWTDYLWFDSLGRSDVWRSQMLVRFGLGVGTTLAFFLLLFGNLALVDRLSPRFTPTDDELVVRFGELVAGRRRRAWAALALLLAIVPGVSAAGQWRDWMLFRNGGSVGATDAQFGVDLGFYLFKLPFLSAVVDWAFGFLIITLIAVVGAHYLSGGIRMQAMGERVTVNAKRHISGLLAAAAIVKCGDYVLRRYELSLGRSGASGVDGAGYTSVNASLPAINLLALIAAFAAVLFVVNIWRRGWTLPVIAVVTWALVGALVGGAYPALVQRFRVEPSELSREREFVARNITATRAALGLDRVVEQDFKVDETLTAEEVAAAEPTIRNLRLQDPAIILKTIQNLQFERDYYTFRDVDVDRYQVDGETTPVVISARELKLDADSLGSWERRHLVFTHGYAAAAAPANEKSDRNEPNFLIDGVPARSERGFPDLSRPEIYHGEDMGGYAIVNTRQTELSSDDAPTTYEGTGGVGIGTRIRRAAFALRNWEIEPLISSYLTSESRVIMNRGVVQRVAAVAPFLFPDPDPYPVISNGRVKYIVDLYTTSDRYPYAQQVNAQTVDPESGVSGGFNYLRNPVKAVVDAYDGTVELYLVDQSLYGEREPIARAWASAFPGLFKDGADLPEDLRAHLRYPEFLFRTQSHMWGRYHQTDADGFFNNSDQWAVGQKPPERAAKSDLTTSANASGLADRIEPHYQYMALPGSTTPEFVLTRPFVRYSDKDTARNLEAMMFARTDGENYGKLVVSIMTNADGERRTDVDGPLTASQKIAVQSRFTAFQTLADSNGSRVRIGNMLIVPVGNSLMYVRPVFAEQDQGGRPQLEKVVVLSGDRFGFGNTLNEAMRDLFSSAPVTEVNPLDPTGENERGETTPSTTTTTTTIPSGGGVGGDPDSLMRRARDRLAAADAALRSGDLAAYQQGVKEAGALLDQALAAGAAPKVDPGVVPPSTAPPGVAPSIEPAPTTTQAP